METKLETNVPCEEGGRPPHQGTRQVGYKRPPKHTQFKKGQSGNPKGPPRGVAQQRAIFDSIMREPVRLRESGKVKTVSTSDALMHVLSQGVLRSEPKALSLQSYLEKKLGLFDLPGAKGERAGYLVVPPKLSREEWREYAQRALRNNIDPPPKSVVRVSIDEMRRITQSRKDSCGAMPGIA